MAPGHATPRPGHPAQNGRRHGVLLACPTPGRNKCRRAEVSGGRASTRPRAKAKIAYFGGAGTEGDAEPRSPASPSV
ncbi:unnamed protein product [Lota lota]